MEEERDSKISCVIPTYNRCPNRREIQYNPIWWVAHALFKQSNVGEIVFVDDGSDDYFLETIERIQESSNGIDIKYLRHEKRKGSGESRNRGVALTTNNDIFFMDDDCVTIGDQTLPHLQRAASLLRQEGVSVGVVSLPVYGYSWESESSPISKIGKLDRKTGIFHGCYTKFPEEYSQDLENSYLDKGEGIFRPVEIDFTGGVFLCDREAYLRAGGFPNLRWRNSALEEAEFMLKLRRDSNKNFYLPSLDDKFGVFHFNYGKLAYADFSIEDRFEGISFPFSVPGITLEEAFERSLVQRRNHGNRVSKEDAFYSHIMSTTRLFFTYYGGEVALNYLETTFSGLRGDIKKMQVFNNAVRDSLRIMDEEGIVHNDISKKVLEKYLS